MRTACVPRGDEFILDAPLEDASHAVDPGVDDLAGEIRSDHLLAHRPERRRATFADLCNRARAKTAMV